MRVRHAELHLGEARLERPKVQQVFSSATECLQFPGVTEGFGADGEKARKCYATHVGHASPDHRRMRCKRVTANTWLIMGSPRVAAYRSRLASRSAWTLAAPVTPVAPAAATPGSAGSPLELGIWLMLRGWVGRSGARPVQTERAEVLCAAVEIRLSRLVARERIFLPVRAPAALIHVAAVPGHARAPPELVLGVPLLRAAPCGRLRRPRICRRTPRHGARQRRGAANLARVIKHGTPCATIRIYLRRAARAAALLAPAP